MADHRHDRTPTSGRLRSSGGHGRPRSGSVRFRPKAADFHGRHRRSQRAVLHRHESRDVTRCGTNANLDRVDEPVLERPRQLDADRYTRRRRAARVRASRTESQADGKQHAGARGGRRDRPAVRLFHPWRRADTRQRRHLDVRRRPERALEPRRRGQGLVVEQPGCRAAEEHHVQRHARWRKPESQERHRDVHACGPTYVRSSDASRVRHPCPQRRLGRRNVREQRNLWRRPGCGRHHQRQLHIQQRHLHPVDLQPDDLPQADGQRIPR